MRELLGRIGWLLWIAVFLFPFVVYLLARFSVGANSVTAPALWPLLFFYGLALVACIIAFLIARIAFAGMPLSHGARKNILKLVFLIPLLPGLAYVALLALALSSGGSA